MPSMSTMSKDTEVLAKGRNPFPCLWPHQDCIEVTSTFSIGRVAANLLSMFAHYRVKKLGYLHGRGGGRDLRSFHFVVSSIIVLWGYL